jgi:pimeloyl-ACP methyl ester carboxylesterase
MLQRSTAVAAPPAVVFDGAGSAMDYVVSTLQDDAAPAIGQAQAIQPLVITVSGLEMGDINIGSISVGQILALWRKLFPNQPADEKLIRARLAQLQEEMRLPSNKGEKRPSNYVETAMREAAKRNGYDIDIVDFEWSRDPDDTQQTVARFVKQLQALQKSPAARGRPLYIVAHSWGTVLMHEALVRLAEKGETVEVQRFVSLGSPLVPSRIFIWIFKKLQNWESHLQRNVSKPKGVRQWTNLWAGWDPYSNAIEAADQNIRVDLPAAPYEARLKALLHTPKKKIARKDLGRLRQSGRWHFSYLLGFKVELASLQEGISLDILQERLADVLPLSSLAAAPAGAE